MRLLLIIWSFFYISASAQDLSAYQSTKTYFDQPEGLRKAGLKKVKCLFRDSRNLTWVGTQNGIFRYDGTNSVYIKHEQGNNKSIPDNAIASIIEDRKGYIWVGTLGGVARLNPYNLQCEVYRDSLHNFTGDFDNKLIIDEHGKIWSGNERGLQLFNEQQNKFITVWNNQQGGKSQSSYVTCLITYAKDSLILGTFTDIVILNSRNFQFRRISINNKEIPVTSLLLDPYKHLWIGTWGYGCIITDLLFRSYTSLLWQRNKDLDYKNIALRVNYYSTNHDPSVWITSPNSILKVSYNKSGDPDIAKINLFNDPFKIADDNTCLLADEEGFIWVGNSFGVFRFPADQNRFSTLPVKLKGFVEEMQQFFFNNKPYLIVSTWHGKQGLTLFDEKANVANYFYGVPDKTISASNISGVAVDRKNRMWVSTLAGVCVINEKMQCIFDFSKDAKGIDKLSSPKTCGVFIYNDTVWVLCYKKGIDLYDLNFHKLGSYVKGKDGLVDDLFWRVHKDKSGQIWVCGNDFFYKYNSDKGSFKVYDFNADKTKYHPIDIGELSDGTLAIATQFGVIHLNPRNETFYRIVSPLLQRDEIINSVSVDYNDDIWYITSDRLISYHPSTRKFTIFGEEDGLDVQNGDLQFLRTFDGKRFVLAEANDIVEFYPEQWKKTVPPPQLFLHAIQVNDSIIRSDKPITNLNLHYPDSKIYFEFDGINYYKPEQNQYAYRLAGIDNNWVFSDKNSAFYVNLSPGTYDFHVKAANYAGVWSKETLIHIFIKPPYWQTWWFIGLVVIAVGSIFFFFIKYIAQRNLRERILRLEKEQAVEKERNRIANDMHDDLGSGLTKIAILSEVAKTQLGKREAVTEQLEKISYSSRELVDSLQDIIWVLNPKNDLLESMAAYIREYALKFFESTDIHLYFDYPEYMPVFKLSEEQRRNTFLVLKETLNNTAKHSHCTEVVIKFHVFENNLQISIQDNGRGFNNKKIRGFANGLANMRSRMKQIGGYYDIDSVINKGTKTTLTIPL